MIQSNAMKYYMVDKQTGMKLYAPDNISAEEVRKFNMQAEPAPNFTRSPNGKPKNPFENRGKSDFTDRKGNPAFTQFKNLFESSVDPVEQVMKEVIQADSSDVKTGVASVINEKIEKNPKVSGIYDDSWDKMQSITSSDLKNDAVATSDESSANKSNKDSSSVNEESQVTRNITNEDDTKSAAAVIQGTGVAAKEAISEVKNEISPDALKFSNFYGENFPLNLSDQNSFNFIKDQRKDAISDFAALMSEGSEAQKFININAPTRDASTLEPNNVVSSIDGEGRQEDNLIPQIQQPVLPEIDIQKLNELMPNIDFEQLRNFFPMPDLTEQIAQQDLTTAVESETPTLTPDQTELPQESFIDAFTRAREKGEKEFEWYGVKYQTGVDDGVTETDQSIPDLTLINPETTALGPIGDQLSTGAQPTASSTPSSNLDGTSGTVTGGTSATEQTSPTSNTSLGYLQSKSFLDTANFLARMFTGKPYEEETPTATKSSAQTSTFSSSTAPTQSLIPSESAEKSAGLTPTGSKSLIVQNTEEILKNQAENASMSSPISVAQSQQPIVVNNTTMIPPQQSTDKTKEVFSDESTFTRLTAMDVYHPSGYPGFRYG